MGLWPQMMSSVLLASWFIIRSGKKGILAILLGHIGPAEIDYPDSTNPS